MSEAAPKAKPKTKPNAAVVKRAVRAFEAMRTHSGAQAGEEWERKIAEWRSAFWALRRHGRALISEEERDA